MPLRTSSSLRTAFRRWAVSSEHRVGFPSRTGGGVRETVGGGVKSRCGCILSGYTRCFCRLLPFCLYTSASSAPKALVLPFIKLLCYLFLLLKAFKNQSMYYFFTYSSLAPQFLSLRFLWVSPKTTFASELSNTSLCGDFFHFVRCFLLSCDCEKYFDDILSCSFRSTTIFEKKNF